MWIWTVVGLAIFVAVVSGASWLSRQTAPSHALRTPTLVDLVRQSESFEGERVRVSGDVRVFEAGTPDEYYVLEQDGQYRVAMHGLPNTTLRPMTNGRMTVEGEFHFEEGVGRYIDVTAWTEATPTGTG